MADYKLTGDPNTVIRTSDGATIPADGANRDWIEYEQWRVDGGIPDPVPPPISPALDDLGTGKTTAQILGAT